MRNEAESRRSFALATRALSRRVVAEPARDRRGAAPDSLTLVLPGHAHTVGHLGCMPSIIESFVEAGQVDGLDASCVSTGVPLPPFRTSP